MELLSVDNLSVSFGDVPVLNRISFSLKERSVLGIVGESGCGKTTLLRNIMGTKSRGAQASGTVRFLGEDLLTASPKKLQSIRGLEIAMIPQNAFLAMDSTKTVSSLFWETVWVHHPRAKKKVTDRKAVELMERLHLEEPERILRSYPFELSGGMCQRVMIAAATMNMPRLLLADEPTSALDAAAQKMVLQELNRLKEEFSISMLLVSHNLSVVAYLADTIAVMREGELVEIGTKEKILNDPEQEYTRELLAAVPTLQ